MNYAAIKNCDIANGPGVRVSLFVSGCRHHCKDCFNPETWDFACGEPFDEAVMDKLLALLAPGYIRGITYLGGEPFEPENQPGLLALSRRIKAAYPEKSIWSFTGYLFDRDILTGSSARGRSRRSFCPISTCWSTGRSSRRSKISISGSAARPTSG